MTERRAEYMTLAEYQDAELTKVPSRVRFFVDGKPVPKQSFRALKTGGGYIPGRVKAWQQLVAQHAALAMRGRDLFTGPVYIQLTFCLPTRHRVDCDNLSKAVLDSLNGIAFADDNQVVSLFIRKLYTTPPGVEVIVEG